MFKFDIKFLNETYFFISCAYKIKNRLKFKVYDHKKVHLFHANLQNQCTYKSQQAS